MKLEEKNNNNEAEESKSSVGGDDIIHISFDEPKLKKLDTEMVEDLMTLPPPMQNLDKKMVSMDNRQHHEQSPNQLLAHTIVFPDEIFSSERSGSRLSRHSSPHKSR